MPLFTFPVRPCNAAAKVNQLKGKRARMHFAEFTSIRWWDSARARMHLQFTGSSSPWVKQPPPRILTFKKMEETSMILDRKGTETDKVIQCGRKLIWNFKCNLLSILPSERCGCNIVLVSLASSTKFMNRIFDVGLSDFKPTKWCGTNN